MSKSSDSSNWPKLYEATINLSEIKQSPLQEMLQFYSKNYKNVCHWILRPGAKIILRDSVIGSCRFCGLSKPAVSFKKEAHALPECLGNKTLFSSYECDSCNELFGNGIENDFGNWSKPMRLLAKIKGKKGVPIIREANGSLRFEETQGGLAFSHNAGDSKVFINEIRKEITFTLQRDPYVPIAVLKAFVKMGLTVLPETERVNFISAYQWIRQADHTLDSPFKWPINHTLLPGLYWNSPVSVIVFRRRRDILPVPYMFCIVHYGNEVFQTFLPSERDAHIDGRQIEFCRFPTPLDFRPNLTEPPRAKLIDLTGTTQVRGEIVRPIISYENRSLVDSAPKSYCKNS